MPISAEEINPTCRAILVWFEAANIPAVSIFKLRTWKAKGANGHAFEKLSERVFRRWVINSDKPRNTKPSRKATPLEATAPTVKWINELHRIISLDATDATLLELEQYLGARRPPNISREILPFKMSSPSPSSPASGPMGAEELCQIALGLAREGLHYDAWHTVKSAFEMRVIRDFDFAMRLVPTFIYLAYRYFGISRISDTAAAVSVGLARSGRKYPFCDDALRNLCLVQLCNALSEHGQPALASHMLNANDMKAFLNANMQAPWPMVQNIRCMASHLAVHHPTSRQDALDWLKLAEELNSDQASQRASAAVHYGIHVHHGERGNLHGCDAIIGQYEKSRVLLLEAVDNPHAPLSEIRQVANNVYFGSIARSLWDTQYSRKSKADDIRALQWALFGESGVRQQEMDDDLMPVKMDELSSDLQWMRKKMLRERFVRGTTGLAKVTQLLKELSEF